MTEMPSPVGAPDLRDLRVNVALIVPRTEAEGPGVRAAVWVQGCALRCPGCCNPEMLAHKDALWTSVADVLAQVPADVEGVSLLGGEPTEQAGPLAALARAVRARGQTVMLYTGHTLEELRSRGDRDVDALVGACDLVVDGRYVEALRTTTRRYIGSTNQVLHFLSDRYRADDPRLAQPNTVELRLSVDAQGRASITMNGWPVHGARTLPIVSAPTTPRTRTTREGSS